MTPNVPVAHSCMPFPYHRGEMKIRRYVQDRRKTHQINRAGEMESVRTAGRGGSLRKIGSRYLVSEASLIVLRAEILDALKSPS